MITPIKKFKDLPWENPLYEDVWYASFYAIEPRCRDHRVYIPKENTLGCISCAFSSAYKVGETFVGTNQWKGYSIIFENGEEAGQTIGWPIIHLLPILQYNG